MNKLFAVISFLSLTVLHLTLSAGELNLSEAEKAWLKEHPTIVYGADSLYEPVEFHEDGVQKGMSRDYIKLIEKKLGVEFVHRPAKKWSETHQALLTGEIDFVPTLKMTPERRELNFTENYISLRGVLITSKSNSRTQWNLEKMDGVRIALVKGYFWNDLVARDFPKIKRVNVETMGEGLQATALGTADAFLGSFAIASTYIQKNQITNLHVAAQAPYEIEYAMATRKGAPELASIFNKALKTITSEEHKAIKDRWIKLSDEEPMIDEATLNILFGLLGLALLLMFGSIFWSYSLRKQVQQKTKELRNTNQSLEDKVEERTQDLRRANERLRGARDSLQDSNEKLEDEANRDALTGVANRRRLNDYLAEAIIDAKEKKQTLTLMMADIDYFKQFNDHYGHVIGDDCLVEVAQCLRRYCSRDGDFVARYGGEEFTLIFKGIGAEAALKHAELILEKIRDLHIENIDSPDKPYITISIGVITLDPGDDLESAKEFLERSDKALYKAKNAGRNQVVVYSAS